MTYKNLSLLLFVAVVGLSVALVHQIGRHEVADYTEPKVVLIRETRDSLTHVILATQDTLLALRQVLDGKMHELAKARLNTLKSNQEHEAIHFVPLSDSARVRALSELYHSYQVP